jgi:hypothetical protein
MERIGLTHTCKFGDKHKDAAIMKIDKRNLLFFATPILGLFIIASIIYWWPQRSGAPTWHGIIPGKTTTIQVIDKLGLPDEYESNDECTKLHYSGRQIEGWSVFDIFVRGKDRKGLVVGIYLLIPTLERVRDQAELTRSQNLGLFVSKYGKPEEVMFSSLGYFRFLIWATDGMMIRAAAQTPLRDFDTLYVSTIFMFEPQETHAFLSNIPCSSLMFFTEIPGFGPASDSDRDPLPEDPYRWEELFELPATESP